MTDLKTIIMVMNTLESLYEYMYYEMTEESRKEYKQEIINYRKFLGFDDEFMKLKIKW